MVKPILVANWKNYPSSLNEAQTLIKGLSNKKILYKKLSLFIAPPSPYLGPVSEKAKSFSHLACQDISPASKTTTGAVTIDILKSFGVKLAIIGHSERRALGESSEEIAEKIKIAIKSGITPLLCIGELVRDEDGDYFEFLRKQLESALGGFTRKSFSSSGLAIAYEPVWAIGEDAKGVIEPLDLTQTLVFIKKVLSNIFGRSMAEKIPILYGGSVDPGNVDSLIKNTGVRGLLIGRASLDASSLGKIAEAMILIK